MAHFGDLFIAGAMVSVVLTGALYLFVWSGKEHLRSLARYFFAITGSFLGLALALLLYLILTHDYSVAYVYSYSSSDLPLFFKIASLWGGQEGTFLLWIFFVSVLGLIMSRTAGEFESGNMVVVSLFIISVLLILIKKSPFELLPEARAEGFGLNPLLQNFWMTIHPPIMFVGFAGVVIPFAFAVTALVTKRFNSWAEAARRWTLFGWVTLGGSLVMGGYWAYKTLGWGGFWAWDPVENSSFIPWIFLTAQVHSLFIQRKRRGLMRFSLFVVCMTFLSVLYGTFLTRSGVLGDFSVHSFVDLGINQFLIAGLLFFTALAGFLLIFRWSAIRPEPSFSKANSRSYLVTLGITVLFLGGVLTLLGTSTPLLTRATDTPSNVGIYYYFITMTPIAITLLVLLTLFPAFKWNQGLSKPGLLIAGASAAVVTIITLLSFGITTNIMYLLLFGAAAGALISNGYVVGNGLRHGRIKSGYLAHVGLAIALIGAAASAGFESKETVTLPQGEQIGAMGYHLTFIELEETAKGFDCHVEVKSDRVDFVAILPHEFPSNAEGVMKKPHVEKFLGYDLYLSPLAIESAEEGEPVTIAKGETIHVDKYTITFEDFELGDHSENGPTSIAAELVVSFDDSEVNVRPVLSLAGDKMESSREYFDYDRASVAIAGVRPDDGAVLLDVGGDFQTAEGTAGALLIIELSNKPLINLFWLGTLMVCLSGVISIVKRRRRQSTATITEISSAQPVASGQFVRQFLK